MHTARFFPSTDLTADVVVGAPRPVRHEIAGLWLALTAVTIWAAYQAYARLGITTGLIAPDFALLRFVTAGAIMAPVLLRSGVRDLGGVGWGRGLVLALAAGPLFIVLGAGGYSFAPLAVGAVVQPAAITLFSLPFAWWLLRLRPTRDQYVGIGLVAAGLATILLASHSPTGAQAGSNPLLGTVLFIGAGMLWALFTVLIKRWRVEAFAATAAVSVLSAMVTVPVYLALYGTAHIRSIPLDVIVLQAMVQGVGSGVIAVIAFGKAVDALGPHTASLFTALVPGMALIIGVPVAGEVPTLGQIAGALLVMLGVVATVLLPRLAARARRRG